MLGGGAGVLLVAGGAGLVLPVDVHEEEEAEGDDGEEGLEGGADDRGEALPEAVEAGEGQEEEHDRLRAGGVAEDHPLQSHERSVEMWETLTLDSGASEEEEEEKEICWRSRGEGVVMEGQEGKGR